MPEPFNLTERLALISARSYLQPYFSSEQFETLTQLSNPKDCEEAEFFVRRLIDLAKHIGAMPLTYQQDGTGDQAIVGLHYFSASSDWFITEKDMDGGIDQAFGYAVLNGADEFAELGYISIRELASCGAELDLYFTPCTLAEVKAKRRLRRG